MEDDPTKIMQYVNTGEVYAATAGTILNSGAIGSCVVIAACDLQNKVGGMAHVMLPGESPPNGKTHRTKYGKDAIKELLNQLTALGADKKNIKVCLLGGANVLKRINDTIGIDNINSVKKFLNKLQVTVCAESLGGTERRTALFDIETTCVYFTVGDAKEKLLWNFENQ